MSGIPLLIGLSSEDSARSWLYPQVWHSDEIVFAGRVLVEGVTHLACLARRAGDLCLVTGTHRAPCDYPDLHTAEHPTAAEMLCSMATHRLLVPDVATLVGQWCREDDIVAALASGNPHVRESVVRALPFLRFGQT